MKITYNPKNKDERKYVEAVNEFFDNWQDAGNYQPEPAKPPVVPSSVKLEPASGKVVPKEHTLLGLDFKNNNYRIIYTHWPFFKSFNCDATGRNGKDTILKLIDFLAENYPSLCNEDGEIELCGEESYSGGGTYTKFAHPVTVKVDMVNTPNAKKSARGKNDQWNWVEVWRK